MELNDASPTCGTYRSSWLGHTPRIEQRLEPLFRENVLSTRNFTYGLSCPIGFFRDFRRRIVADFRSQSVHMAKLCSMKSRQRSSSAFTPSMQRAAKLLDALAKNSMDWSNCTPSPEA